MRRQYSALKEGKKERTFNNNFNELVLFLKKFERFPDKTDNPSLYNWMAALRNEKKKGYLNLNYEERLNTINFILG